MTAPIAPAPVTSAGPEAIGYSLAPRTKVEKPAGEAGGMAKVEKPKEVTRAGEVRRIVESLALPVTTPANPSEATPPQIASDNAGSRLMQGENLVDIASGGAPALEAEQGLIAEELRGDQVPAELADQLAWGEATDSRMRIEGVFDNSETYAKAFGDSVSLDDVSKRADEIMQEAELADLQGNENFRTAAMSRASAELHAERNKREAKGAPASSAEEGDLTEENIDLATSQAEQQASQTPEGQAAIKSNEWKTVIKQLKDAARSPENRRNIEIAMSALAELGSAQARADRLDGLAKDPKALHEATVDALRRANDNKATPESRRQAQEELNDLNALQDQLKSRAEGSKEDPEIVKQAKFTADSLRDTARRHIASLKGKNVGQELINYLTKLTDPEVQKKVSKILYKVENSGRTRLGFLGTLLALILALMTETGKAALDLKAA